ncbi:MAG: hypothetical protein IJ634_05985 [Bacteroidales bacterium]|nr:hypothetical protein [Bacteroidales bacterium]
METLEHTNTEKPVVKVVRPGREKKELIIPYVPGFTCEYLVPDPFNTEI